MRTGVWASSANNRPGVAAATAVAPVILRKSRRVRRWGKRYSCSFVCIKSFIWEFHSHLSATQRFVQSKREGTRSTEQKGRKTSSGEGALQRVRSFELQPGQVHRA